MMNMTLPPRFAAPYHMNSLPTALSTPWSSIPFTSPFVPPMTFPTSTMAVPKTPSRRSSFSNMRYNSLKESRNFTRRRASPQSVDGFTTTYTRRPSRTKSISNLKSVSESSSSFLPRAHSWHSMGNVHSLNYSVAYANEMHLTPKSKRRRSMRRKKKPMVPPVPALAPPPPPPLSPQRRRGSFRKIRKPSIPLPERGVVRISTLDELPLPTTPRFKRRNSLNTDRLSTKGSIAASSIKRQTKCRNQSIQTQTMKSNDNNEKGSRINVDHDNDDDIQSVSSVSSNTSASSVQQRINRSLRNDPCISAAIEEFRLHQRNSDHSTTVSPHPRHRRRSRESIHSESTIRSPTPSINRSRSRSHSQSSFTSIERSEIRQIIKNIKCNETQSVESVSRSSSVVPPAPPINNLTPVTKPKRSLVTEELDREFNKLRALIPDQELTYVTPSSFCKRKKSTGKGPAPLPPLPTFSELLRKVQLRPVDKSALTKPLTIEEPLKKLHIDSIPVVVVPQSSPIPTYESLPDEDIKHDYAKPMKKSVEPGPPTVCRFQPLRSLSTKSSVTNYSRSLSALNQFQNSPNSNKLPTTFQPAAVTPTLPLPPPPTTDYATTSVNENIYASDIDVHLPMTTIENPQIDDLQVHLENQTILTDYYYTDYDLKVKSEGSSSVLHDLTRVFKRKHEQKIRLTPPSSKHSRCSIM